MALSMNQTNARVSPLSRKPPDDASPCKTNKKTINRELILDAGRKIFAEIGYGDATIRDIIRATPLAAGTFYNHFKTKEEVLLAIQDEIATQARPRMNRGCAEARNAREFFYRAFSTGFEFIAHQKSVGLCYLNMHTDVPMMTSPQFIACMRELKSLIEGATAKGVLPPLDAALLQTTMSGMVMQIGKQMVATGSPSPDEATDFLTELFLGGIGAVSASSSARCTTD